MRAANAVSSARGKSFTFFEVLVNDSSFSNLVTRKSSVLVLSPRFSHEEATWRYSGGRLYMIFEAIWLSDMVWPMVVSWFARWRMDEIVVSILVPRW